MIRNGTDAVKLQAIKILEDLEAASARSVGPPPPRTDEDRTSRLAMLMVAVGEAISRAALVAAFPPPEQSPQEANAG